jgi:Leucine-rich repeat (LRR) protein
MSENELASFNNFKGHSTILKLDLRKNKLKNCQGIANMERL